MKRMIFLGTAILCVCGCLEPIPPKAGAQTNAADPPPSSAAPKAAPPASATPSPPGSDPHKASLPTDLSPSAPSATSVLGAPGADGAPVNTDVRVRVFVVNLDGNPLRGMMPIATSQPNAFDKPMAEGTLTGEDGKGYVTVPTNMRVYVRAWDPALKLFANNYLEVPAGSGTDTDVMKVVMVPGATLKARLYTPAVQPAIHENVGLMLFHSNEGAWWPAESDTDGQGFVTLTSLPAGQYRAKLKIASGAQVEIPEVKLPPGGTADLGPLLLQPPGQP